MENELDLIIIDVNMPGLDGITMLKMLKENKLGSSVPKIILTTEVSTSLNIDIKNETENVKTWVIKPINKKKLVSIIKRIEPDWYIL